MVTYLQHTSEKTATRLEELVSFHIRCRRRCARFLFNGTAGVSRTHNLHRAQDLQLRGGLLNVAKLLRERLGVFGGHHVVAARMAINNKVNKLLR